MFKKLSMPEMRVWRFTHNHLLFKKKKIALPEMRVRRFTHSHYFLVKKSSLMHT